MLSRVRRMMMRTDLGSLGRNRSELPSRLQRCQRRCRDSAATEEAIAARCSCLIARVGQYRGCLHKAGDIAWFAMDEGGEAVAIGTDLATLCAVPWAFMTLRTG